MTKNKFLKSLIIATFIFLIAVTLVNAAVSYRVNNGTTSTINEWSVCKKVTNSTGKDIFVPTNTSNEWNLFRTYYPSGISLAECWACGDPITFTYSGSEVTYGTVSHNGECWLDRNLGASRVATAYNDSSAYGHLFQWGRCADGHQITSSSLYTGPVSTPTCNGSGQVWNGKFIIIASDAYPYDWISPQNNNLWQGVSGQNNPCPSGWRIPSRDEWQTELNSWSQKNWNGAFNSPLKLTAAGRRNWGSGAPGNQGERGEYWSYGLKGTDIYSLYFDSDEAYESYGRRVIGYSVRCIKD